MQLHKDAGQASWRMRKTAASAHCYGERRKSISEDDDDRAFPRTLGEVQKVFREAGRELSLRKAEVLRARQRALELT